MVHGSYGDNGGGGAIKEEYRNQNVTCFGKKCKTDNIT
jgi:hypothetical protein